MRDDYVIIAGLGKKIGINGLATEDFDLVFADANLVEKFCTQFESTDLTAREKFHFMQLIVASLDEALKAKPHFANEGEQRVEGLLSSNPKEYEYIIDYWASVGDEVGGTNVRPMMRRLIQKWNLTSLPFSSTK